MCVVNVGVVPHDTHEPEPGCAVSFTWMQQMEPGCSASQMVTLEQGFIRALPMGVSTRLPAGEPSDMKFTGAPPDGPARPRSKRHGTVSAKSSRESSREPGVVRRGEGAARTRVGARSRDLPRHLEQICRQRSAERRRLRRKEPEALRQAREQSKKGRGWGLRVGGARALGGHVRRGRALGFFSRSVPGFREALVATAELQKALCFARSSSEAPANRRSG